MRRLRIRLLVNSWTVPQILPVLAVIWTADAFLIVVLAIPWLLLSLAAGLFATYETHAALLDLTSAPQAHGDTLYIVAHYYPPLTLGLVGIWTAALGTLWHVRQDR